MTGVDRAYSSYLTALVVLILVVFGIMAIQFGLVFDDSAVDQEWNESRAYCYQRYGDARIDVSSGIGANTGWHCMGNDGRDPHLHDVTDEAKAIAYETNQSQNRSINLTDLPNEALYTADGNESHPGPLGELRDTFVSASSVAIAIFMLAIVAYGILYGPRR